MNGKLSASGIALFLKSPRAFYWSYVQELTGPPSTQNFDHDKLFGIQWASFVDRFYKGIEQQLSTRVLLTDLADSFAGWVPYKTLETYRAFAEILAADYYQQFRPDDGARTANQSEMFIENDLFFGYLDGLSTDRIIHEVKSTSRCPQLSEQLWKFHNSTQIKLYAVLTEADGVRMEFAWKDKPNVNFRAPVYKISKEQRGKWNQSLRALAERILSLGDDIGNYPCHPDGCSLITKRWVSPCLFQSLCDDIPNAVQLYTKRTTIR